MWAWNLHHTVALKVAKSLVLSKVVGHGKQGTCTIPKPRLKSMAHAIHPLKCISAIHTVPTEHEESIVEVVNNLATIFVYSGPLVAPL